MNRLKTLSRARLKSYKKLTQKKYRYLERKFIVEGERSVREALRSDREIEALLLTERAGTLIDYGTYKHVPSYKISEKDLESISDTVSSQGIIAVVRQKEVSLANLWSSLPTHPILVVLDDVSDPGNVGTIIRTCDWFGVDAVLLSTNSAETYNPKVVRATMGSLFHLPVIAGVDLPLILKEVRSRDFRVVLAVVEDGMPLSEFKPPKKSLIVFGNEARGVSHEFDEVNNIRITIPKFGGAESLNVGIAAGIILYHVAMSRY